MISDPHRLKVQETNSMSNTQYTPPPGWIQDPSGQWHQVVVPPEPKKSAVGGCLLATLIAIFVVIFLFFGSIFAVTMLGRNASTKFSTVGSAVR
jgi:hypothetical protein